MSEEATPIDNWVFGAMAISYFIYRVLDEMDGKQARKTGNSSPLGLLFDHGCDAFTTGYFILICNKFVFGGNSLIGYGLISGCCAVFHITTLEEYYLGELFLQTGNGVTDGSISIIALMLYLAFYGTSSLTHPVTKNGGFYYQLNNVIIFSCWFLFSCTIMTCIYNILNK